MPGALQRYAAGAGRIVSAPTYAELTAALDAATAAFDAATAARDACQRTLPDGSRAPCFDPAHTVNGWPKAEAADGVAICNDCRPAIATVRAVSATWNRLDVEALLDAVQYRTVRAVELVGPLIHRLEVTGQRGQIYLDVDKMTAVIQRPCPGVAVGRRWTRAPAAPNVSASPVPRSAAYRCGELAAHLRAPVDETAYILALESPAATFGRWLDELRDGLPPAGFRRQTKQWQKRLAFLLADFPAADFPTALPLPADALDFRHGWRKERGKQFDSAKQNEERQALYASDPAYRRRVNEAKADARQRAADRARRAARAARLPGTVEVDLT